jgi:hypothetical protein
VSVADGTVLVVILLVIALAVVGVLWLRGRITSAMAVNAWLGIVAITALAALVGAVVMSL